MALLKKLIMVLFMSTAMLAAPSASAIEGGEPEQTLGNVISLIEDTLDAMKNSPDDKEKVGALLKAAKQSSKAVVISGPADMKKQKGSGKLKKSRKAYRAGDIEKAVKMAEEALDLYKQAKAKHFL